MNEKPRQLKVIEGTLKPSRDKQFVDLDLLDEVPPAPPWLPNEHAVYEFNRLAPILHSTGLLTVGGVSALGVLAALHGQLVQTWIDGESPSGHILAQYRQMINDFGLTPVAQSRVTPTKSKPKENAFKANGTR